jgi:CRP/FNR family transcriptional regulator
MGHVQDTDLDQVRAGLLYQSRLAPGDVLIYPGMAFERLYVVRYGSFKTLLLASEGQCHTPRLHAHGDVLGWDGLEPGVHACEVVAMQHASVCVFRYEQLSELSARIPALQRALLIEVSRSMQRDWHQMLLLGCMDGEERVASFLLMLMQRQHNTTAASMSLDLMMTRQDIGNYLGMTLESVSRHLSHFQRRGWIRLGRRRVEIVQLEELENRRDHRRPTRASNPMGRSEQTGWGV